MANYVRRIVSGNKARFKDANLNVELDLVYLTDQIIIMGFPAAGIEGYYRNHREDAKKFLEHRHGDNFWVFNFCPVAENAYPASTFGGRVSRYPFPDHHAPPLAILPLAAREIGAWVDGSSERVAVLHCKAGKGRSGTLACAYLLSMADPPRPPRLQRNYNASEWEDKADELAATLLEVVQDESEKSVEDNSDTSTPSHRHHTGSSTYISPQLESVLALHTNRRMKQPKKADSISISSSGPPSRASSVKPTEPGQQPKIKHGVSIPSQRRFLSYWSRMLSGAAPPGYWGLQATEDAAGLPITKVRLKCITIRMHEPDGVKMTLVRAANAFLERSPFAKTQPAATNLKDKDSGSGGDATPAKGALWASLARYDDEFISSLEEWERETRGDPDSLGRRRDSQAGHTGADPVALEGIRSEKWDNQKMVRGFARMASLGSPRVETNLKNMESGEDSKTLVHVLRPLSDASWVTVKQRIASEAEPHPSAPGTASASATRPPSRTSFEESTLTTESTPHEDTQVEEGVILDAHREVRVKLYMGRVWMGWLWFIPAFHIPSNMPSAVENSDTPPTHHQLLFTRKECDFPLGPGGWIIDVTVDLASVPSRTSGRGAASGAQKVNVDEPPERKSKENSVDESSFEFVEAVLEGDVRGAVEAKQGGGD